MHPSIPFLWINHNPIFAIVPPQQLCFDARISSSGLKKKEEDKTLIQICPCGSTAVSHETYGIIGIYMSKVCDGGLDHGYCSIKHINPSTKQSPNL